MYSKKEIDIMRDSMKEENEKLPEIFKALGEVGRFNIFELLVRESRPLCVADIASVLNISSSSTSQKLKELEIFDILIKERDGKEVCYLVNKDNPTIRLIAKHILHI